MSLDDEFRPRDRLSLLDAMALIVVLALAFVMTRSFLRCFSVLGSIVSTEPVNMRQAGPRIWIYACVPWLLCLSASLWPLRMARGAERFRRAARRPGLAVSYAAWAALAFALVRTAFEYRAEFGSTRFRDVGQVSPGEVVALRVVAMKDFLGAAVVVTWFLIWRAGRWRPEPSWIDRLGRLLGDFWIVFGFAFWVDYLIRR